MKPSHPDERILIVEDDLALAETIADLLEDEGYTTTRCDRTGDIERALDGRGFDLALIDLSVGTDSGLALVPRLRRLSALGEIVVMTGNASLHSAMEALHSGVHAYLPKPFSPEELIGITRRALAQVALKRERQALSDRLALSESLYRSVVESVEACILGVDGTGIISFANRFALRCLSDGSGILGRSLLALTNEAGQRELGAALDKAQRGQSVRDRDALHPQTNGSRTVRWSFTALHATDARSARLAREAELALPTATVLAVGQDITDRVALEQRTAANQALAAIGSLTTGLAHEIRNPLNAAKLQLELMERRAKRGATPELAARLVEPANLVRMEIERLTTMLDEFLSLARPRPPVRTTALVQELLESVIVQESAAAHSAGLVLRCEPVAPALTAQLDVEKVRAALGHLVRNSIDALRPRGQGEIVLSARAAEGDELELMVSDDGPGLSPEMLGRAAFEAFVTTKPAGTGLGLAIVQSVVAQHGAQVELANRPEGGALALMRFVG
ncbi:MAG TPA: response regulator [Polyangiales bacterium]